jgi:hypothetical protein
MGTHAMIGIYNKEDGSVEASYVHYDGYLEGVGRTLVDHYNTQYDAEMVAKGGYMSALYDDYVVTRQEAVHNDIAVPYESVGQFLKNGFDYYGAEYIYLWDGEAWFFASRSQNAFEEVEMNLQNVA